MTNRLFFTKFDRNRFDRESNPLFLRRLEPNIIVPDPTEGLEKSDEDDTDDERMEQEEEEEERNDSLSTILSPSRNKDRKRRYNNSTRLARRPYRSNVPSNAGDANVNVGPEELERMNRAAIEYKQFERARKLVVNYLADLLINLQSEDYPEDPDKTRTLREEELPTQVDLNLVLNRYRAQQQGTSGFLTAINDRLRYLRRTFFVRKVIDQEWTTGVLQRFGASNVSSLSEPSLTIAVYHRDTMDTLRFVSFNADEDRFLDTTLKVKSERDAEPRWFDEEYVNPLSPWMNE